MSKPLDVTALLVAWNNGDARARDLLMEVVYDQLRRLARGFLRRKRPDHSLLPTALVRDLSQTDRPAARAMAERFFADLTIVQPTAVLSLTQATAKRDWVLARVWLFRELRGEMP
jgi:hypothetical protein